VDQWESGCRKGRELKKGHDVDGESSIGTEERGEKRGHHQDLHYSQRDTIRNGSEETLRERNGRYIRSSLQTKEGEVEKEKKKKSIRFRML